MGSILERTAIAKKRIVEYSAMEVYWSLVKSIDFSVISAAACLAWMSLLRILEDVRTPMASSSSRILPSDTERTSRILSSVSFRSFLFAAP